MTDQHVYVEYDDGDVDEVIGEVVHDGTFLVVHGREATHYLNPRRIRALHMVPVSQH
ncbi:hypothetical protein [Streptomyces cacaoi]|uniref:Uncharacterized protein n=1 Tax=Streptomyces cacaoi TaxID=1898 RepID=A0A4Y3QYA2_STRCI|nr:hypothetical protein [Streptomyces cacaoi]GEB50395.1 hypothetical protein SCA03_29460 [Streptomyces cacaoi]